MKIYLVGGAVRDTLLGYPTKDNDWVVVGANAAQMLALDYQPVGADFPVFLHPTSKEEYALARTERKTGNGYKGFSFYAAQDVTLEQDLSRRDLTINAIARAEDGTLIDPYHGQQDLQLKVLRHVSSAFSEDPLRVLRVARFAARYHQLGFSVAPETLQLMREISSAGELSFLSVERVWQEIERALMESAPLTFFKVLNEANALTPLIPAFSNLQQNLALINTADPLKIQARTNTLDTAAKRIAQLFFISQHNNPIHVQQDNATSFSEFLRCPNYTKYLIINTINAVQLLTLWPEISAQQKLDFIQTAGLLRNQDKLTDLLQIANALIDLVATPELFNNAGRKLLNCVIRMTKIDHKSLIKHGFKGADLGREINRLQLEICEIGTEE